jgi:hypothetical protein
MVAMCISGLVELWLITGVTAVSADSMLLTVGVGGTWPGHSVWVSRRRRSSRASFSSSQSRLARQHNSLET